MRMRTEINAKKKTKKKLLERRAQIKQEINDRTTKQLIWWYTDIGFCFFFPFTVAYRARLRAHA